MAAVAATGHTVTTEGSYGQQRLPGGTARESWGEAGTVVFD